MHGPGSPVLLEVNARRLVLTVFAICVGAEILWFALDYVVNYSRLTEIGAIRRMCNNAREDGLGSWFAITQTWMIAMTLWLTVAIARKTGTSAVTAGWVVLAMFFTYMAIDDGAKIHERLGTTFHVIHREGPDGAWGKVLLDFFPSYTWQLVFLPIFGTLGLFTLGFLWFQTPDELSRFMIVTAIGCFVFAVSLDFVEGLDREHPLNLYRIASETFELEGWARDSFRKSAYRSLRHFSKSLEECTEMFGNTLLWCVFIRNLTHRASDLRFVFIR